MLIALRRIFYFELLLLWRRAQEWLYPAAFFLMIISLLPIAFSPDPDALQTLVPGGVWIAALFANILAVTTIFHAELEEGGLEQLMISAVPLSFITLAKLMAHWLCTTLPLILLTPLIGWLFHLPAHVIVTLTLSLLLGTPILTLLGSFAVALTLGMRQQGVMMSLLILPLAAPVIIFGVNMTLQSQAGFAATGPLMLLAGLLILAIIGISAAIAAALRIGLDD